MNMVKYRFYYETIMSNSLDGDAVISYMLKINIERKCFGIGEEFDYTVFDIDVFSNGCAFFIMSKYRIDFILNVLFGNYKKIPCKFVLDLNTAIKRLLYSIPQKEFTINNFYRQKSKINRYIKEHYIRMDV